MAIAFVQSKGLRVTSATPINTTLTTAPTAGNLLVGMFSANSASAAATPAGWTPVTAETGSSVGTAIYMKTAAGGETALQTYTPAAGTSDEWHVVEFSGLTVPTLDVVGGTDSGASTFTHADSGSTGALLLVGELIVAVCFNSTAPGGTLTASNGFTLLPLVARQTCAWKVATDLTSQSTTFSWSTGASKSSGSIAAISPTAPPVPANTGWGIPVG